MLNVMKSEKCDYYIILIINGIQMIGLLRFADYNRLFNTNAKFIMLHDYRLFTPENHFLWKRLINVIYIRKSSRMDKKTLLYELSTVPFPSTIRGIYVSKIVNYFVPPNRFLKKTELFDDKKSQEINGNLMNIVVYSHTPAIIKDYNNDGNKSQVHYTGLEIELINAIGQKMNFNLNFYEAIDSEFEKWGHRVADGNFTGLLGEMNEARADIALADLYHTLYNFEVMDLSYPYTIQCLTFITPEILGDNSWKALILPFTLNMWIGAFLSLFFIIIVFWLFSNCYIFIDNENYVQKDSATGKKTLVKDLFDDFSACIMYPYSMILLVSLPALPNRWSIRLLTGWWWLYCVLLIVAYRASLTSILANPQPRLTIDQLATLANSRIKCGAWGEQNRNLFITSSDPIAQKIGSKLENIDVAEDGIMQVEKGEFAYFESLEELRRLRFQHEMKQSQLSQKLHIMDECAINMPISIGLDKNSPLKEKIDEIILRLAQGGLIKKWFNDAIQSFVSSVEEPPQEALMDIKKFFGALVALGVGYLISICAFLGEFAYWAIFVRRHPKYDKYYKRIILDCEMESLKVTKRRRHQNKKNLANKRSAYAFAKNKVLSQ
ncbi:hypothetical protein ACKWTF_009084 [Chironomus riparius]